MELKISFQYTIKIENINSRQNKSINIVIFNILLNLEILYLRVKNTKNKNEKRSNTYK